jgi:hypothetical protein
MPVDGGVGWVPLYGEIELLDAGVVVSAPPLRTILPPLI